MGAVGQKWQRTEDGYVRGDAEVTDNGAGVGPAKGSGRWAVTIAGRWIENVDTLAEAKRLAEGEATPARVMPMPSSAEERRHELADERGEGEWDV